MKLRQQKAKGPGQDQNCRARRVASIIGMSAAPRTPTARCSSPAQKYAHCRCSQTSPRQADSSKHIRHVIVVVALPSGVAASSKHPRRRTIAPALRTQRALPGWLHRTAVRRRHPAVWECAVRWYTRPVVKGYGGAGPENRRQAITWACRSSTRGCQTRNHTHNGCS
jgi:hypothetical protein